LRGRLSRGRVRKIGCRSPVSRIGGRRVRRKRRWRNRAVVGRVARGRDHCRWYNRWDNGNGSVWHGQMSHRRKRTGPRCWHIRNRRTRRQCGRRGEGHGVGIGRVGRCRVGCAVWSKCVGRFVEIHDFPGRTRWSGRCWEGCPCAHHRMIPGGWGRWPGGWRLLSVRVNRRPGGVLRR